MKADENFLTPQMLRQIADDWEKQQEMRKEGVSSFPELIGTGLTVTLAELMYTICQKILITEGIQQFHDRLIQDRLIARNSR